MDWKIITDYENYEVSDEGVVRNRKTGRHLRPDISWNGYCRITLCKNNKTRKYLAHRLVAREFLGDSVLQVNHINGNKLDNRLVNLEYVTCSENHIHAQVTGLRPIGSARTSALLTEDVVHKVCKMIEDGCVRGEILRAGLSKHLKKHMVDNIRRRRTWRHVSKDYKW